MTWHACGTTNNFVGPRISLLMRFVMQHTCIVNVWLLKGFHINDTTHLKTKAFVGGMTLQRILGNTDWPAYMIWRDEIPSLLFLCISIAPASKAPPFSYLNLRVSNVLSYEFRQNLVDWRRVFGGPTTCQPLNATKSTKKMQICKLPKWQSCGNSNKR